MRKKWTLTVSLVLAMLIMFAGSVYAFTDIRGDQAEADIRALQEAGIVSGIDSQTFAPRGKVTFAQGVHLIVKGFHLNIDPIRFVKKPNASDYFNNVSDDAWYSDSFVIAHLNGLPLDKDVDPQAVMTREQFARLLFSGMSTQGEFAFIEIWLTIKDEKDISADAMDSIQKLLISNIAKLEDGHFYPKREITRGEAAQMLHKAILFAKEHGQENKPAPQPEDGKVTMNVQKVNDDVNRVTVTWGEKPNPGYRIVIDRIEFKENMEAHIYYRTIYPEPGKMYPQVITEAKADTYVAAAYKPVLKPAQDARPGASGADAAVSSGPLAP